MAHQILDAEKGRTFVSTWPELSTAPRATDSHNPARATQCLIRKHLSKTDHSQHPFPRLPSEIRWKIWAMNLPGPRIVSIRCGSSSDLSASHGCTSPSPIPANLHACRESRREALRQRYTPSFGIAHQPGQIFFDFHVDILYFGPRTGFMASEAQLRTVLSLCDPTELARVERVALNDALFWAYEPPHTWRNLYHHEPHHHHHHCADMMMHAAESQEATTHHLASSLLIDVLRLLHARLPTLRELIFVPRAENPLYGRDCCLVAPVIVQSRLARQVREALGVVFGPGADTCPWAWNVMMLGTDTVSPVYRLGDLGTDKEDAKGFLQSLRTGKMAGESIEHRTGEYGVVDNAAGTGCNRYEYRQRGAISREGQESVLTREWAAERDVTNLSAMQESVGRQFMHMGMGVCG